MALFDRFAKTKLILDAATMEKWPERLLRHRRLDEELRKGLDAVSGRAAALRAAKERLADPRLKRKVPERAVPIYEEHLPRILKEAERLAERATFVEDLFLMEEQRSEFQERLTAYRESTQKSVAALKEFFADELRGIAEAAQGLEDETIRLVERLETKDLDAIRRIKATIEEYRQGREKERKLRELQAVILDELETYEKRRRKIKEKIQYYTEQARSGRYKELIAEEEELLEKSDAITVRNLSADEEERQLHPIRQRLAFLRKQMINDITAMNINEQRTFLEAVKDEIRVRRRKLERIGELLGALGYDAYRAKLQELLRPFDARIEDAETIIEEEDDTG